MVHANVLKDGGRDVLHLWDVENPKNYRTFPVLRTFKHKDRVHYVLCEKMHSIREGGITIILTWDSVGYSTWVYSYYIKELLQGTDSYKTLEEAFSFFNRWGFRIE